MTRTAGRVLNVKEDSAEDKIKGPTRSLAEIHSEASLGLKPLDDQNEEHGK